MFLFIMFLVYSSSTFDMVMIDNEFMYMFAKGSTLFTRGLGGRFHVSMVLRYRLPANAPYWPGCVVGHRRTVPLSPHIPSPIDRINRTKVA